MLQLVVEYQRFPGNNNFGNVQVVVPSADAKLLELIHVNGTCDLQQSIQLWRLLACALKLHAELAEMLQALLDEGMVTSHDQLDYVEYRLTDLGERVRREALMFYGARIHESVFAPGDIIQRLGLSSRR